MTQNLINYEKDERHLASRLFNLIPNIETYSFTQGRICYDALVTTKDSKRIITEIKVRKFEINRYPDYILQVDKLKGLIKRANENNCTKVYYINFFENPKTKLFKDFIVFDLTPRIKDWKTNKPIVKRMWMNAETHKSTDYKIEKEVIMLNYDEKIDMKGTFSIN